MLMWVDIRILSHEDAEDIGIETKIWHPNQDLPNMQGRSNT